jgi:hypothetical protein
MVWRRREFNHRTPKSPHDKPPGIDTCSWRWKKTRFAFILGDDVCGRPSLGTHRQCLSTWFSAGADRAAERHSSLHGLHRNADAGGSRMDLRDPSCPRAGCCPVVSTVMVVESSITRLSIGEWIYDSTPGPPSITPITLRRGGESVKRSHERARALVIIFTHFSFVVHQTPWGRHHWVFLSLALHPQLRLFDGVPWDPPMYDKNA